MNALLSVAPLVLAAPASFAQEVEAPAEEENGLIFRAEGAFEGYTLFAPLRSTSTYLVDMDGDVVHEWESEHQPGNSAYLLDDGTLLRSCRVTNDVFTGRGQGGRIQTQAWDGTVLWDFDYSNEAHLQHHDIEPLPNGNVLMVAWEVRTHAQAVAAGRDPAQLSPRGLWPCFVVEIEPILPDGGRIVWEWHVWDHLIQDFDRTKANHDDVTEHPELVDLNGDHRDQPPMTAEERRKQEEIEREMRALGYAGDEEQDDDGRPLERRPGDLLHTNSIDYHPGLDLIVLSVRRFHEVWVIDHSTTTAEAAGHAGGRYGKGGDLLYRWGNPRTYGMGDDGDRQLFGQHDATWVGGADGKPLCFLVFNNGGDRPGGDRSTVDEVVLPFDHERGFHRTAGEAFGSAAPAWSYGAGEGERFYASFISGAQRLPNGNTLVCSGPRGRLFEVTRDKRRVWEYFNPFGESPRTGDEVLPTGRRPNPNVPKGLFRSTHLAPDHPGSPGRICSSRRARRRHAESAACASARCRVQGPVARPGHPCPRAAR